VDPINAGQLMNRNSVRQQQKKQRQQRHNNRRRPTLEDDQVERSPIDELASGGQNYSHIINGYIGSRQLLIKLALLVRRLKRANPALQFVCDPVMGDYGPGLYVPANLVPIYQD
jgi:pyridoxal/pyridoxine/pyridoxamine kinase